VKISFYYSQTSSFFGKIFCFIRRLNLSKRNFAGAGLPVKAATLQIFRVFCAFRGQKMGCGRQPTPSRFVWFVVKKWVCVSPPKFIFSV